MTQTPLRRLLLLLLLLLVAGCATDDSDGADRCAACGPGAYCNHGDCVSTSVDFPRDAGPHEMLSEWWYYTGHLTSDDDGHRWGYEITIFQYNLSETAEPNLAWMCHVAVTDSTRGVHVHTDEFIGAPDIWTVTPTELAVGSCHFELGGDGHDRVRGIIPAGKEKHGDPGEWVLELAMAPRKRVAIHGTDGIIDMSEGGGTSWYYSYTRLEVAGTLHSTVDGEVAVQGEGWMDHQWGEFHVNQFKGWDWWSMQLADDHEIMLFQFRDWDDVLVSQAGTIVDPDGNLTALEGLDAFAITSRRTWASPHTDGVYPLDWDITIPAPAWQLAVTTAIDDQEMPNLAQNYWEGEVAITGTRGRTAVSGQGYVELTGYASDWLDPKP